MCGIFAYLLKNKQCNEDKWITECHERASTLKPRGPEKYKYTTSKNVFMGFQRLSIVDLSDDGDQPFSDSSQSTTLICNGEIYNSKYLTEKYKLPVRSKSDCEVILHLYIKFGIRPARFWPGRQCLVHAPCPKPNPLAARQKRSIGTARRSSKGMFE